MQKEQIGLATLYLGDCRDVLPAISAQAVITDPPYGINYVSSRRKQGKTERLVGDDDAPTDTVQAIANSIKDGGALYLSTRFDVSSGWVKAVIDSGLKLKTPIFWDKGNHTSGDLRGDFGARVEIFIFAHKGRHLLRGKRQPNLWRAARDGAGFHPTPKPVELMRRMIMASTDLGDAVADPFMGGGSTGVAAVSLGRPFIGVEIDPRYFDMACKRIEAAQANACVGF